MSRLPIRPAPSSAAARNRMLSVRQRDTALEKMIRSLLHRAGFRYRVDKRPLQNFPSRADLVFIQARVAVFLNGCFWHGCRLHGTWPKANAGWWRNKIESNMSRDVRIDTTLRRAGWRVIRIWEHEDPEK